MPRIKKVPFIRAAKINEGSGVSEGRGEQRIVLQNEKPRPARIPGLPKDFKVTEEAPSCADRWKAPVVRWPYRVEKLDVPLSDGYVETRKLPLDLRPAIHATGQADNTDRVKRREYQCHEGTPFLVEEGQCSSKCVPNQLFRRKHRPPNALCGARGPAHPLNKR